jgi:hypothetical protein
MLHKNRGEEIIAFLKTIPLPLREQRINVKISPLDIWQIWLHLASEYVGPSQTSFVFMKYAPCYIDVYTTHRHHMNHMETSSVHTLDILSPYVLFGNNIRYILQPSIYDIITVLKCSMRHILGCDDGIVYDYMYWHTSLVTFYEVDLAHKVYYQYADVTLTCIDNDVSISIPHRRTRAAPNVVSGHIAVLADMEM